MITGRIKAMLEACEAGDPSFPPNVLFNESWLLRIILDWFEGHGGDRYPLSLYAGRTLVLRGVAPPRPSCPGIGATGSPRAGPTPTASSATSPSATPGPRG